MKVDEKILHMLGVHVTGDFGPYTFYTSRRHGVVWFVRAPALKPPTPLQTHQRNKFRLAGYIWRNVSADMKEHWSLATRRARLNITPYNFFTYYILTMDLQAVRTVERLSGVQLLPLEWLTA